MKEIIFPEVEAINGPPVIKKNGIIYPRGSEMSIFVYKGRLKYLKNGRKGPKNRAGTALIGDYLTREEGEEFGGDGAFFSVYCENDTVYAFSTRDNHVIRYVSKDLVNWSAGEIIVTFPENFKLYNTAVCKGEDGYRMAVECGYEWDDNRNWIPNEYIGVQFTEFFAQSPDLKNWELLPLEKNYSPKRYVACPALEYCEGYYYMICLEELPLLRYAPYIYRTKDFETWEIGFYNPILMPSREDLTPKPGVIVPPERLEVNFKNLNTNNSDIDLCEFEGKTYIFYASGNQGNTWGGLYCEAVYDGTLSQFLKANFS